MTNQMPETARVWIYQADRPFTAEEATQIEARLQNFVQQWTSHQKSLKAAAEIRYQQFLILMVDEQYEAPSGCSIDSSVALIKSIEADFHLDLFNRLLFAWKDSEGRVQTADRSSFAALYAAGTIEDNTIVFNNMVQNHKALQDSWEVALSDSWHAKMV